jgi:hypothetical protein
MSVLVRAEVPGMTEQQYDGFVQQLEPVLRQSPGFISHAGYPIAGGWSVVEVWESEADYDRWMQGTVLPAMKAANAPEPRLEVFPIRTLISR